MAMTDRVAKTLLYEQFARVGKALASPVRLELLDLLAQGERGVEDLAGAAGLRLSNASAQLQVLASAGLATCRRSGRRVYYRLAGDAAGLLAAHVQQFACERLAEAERAARPHPGRRRSRSGRATGRRIRRRAHHRRRGHPAR